MHLEQNFSILQIKCGVLAGDDISLTGVSERMNGRSMTLEESNPYSTRCTADGKGPLIVCFSSYVYVFTCSVPSSGPRVSRA